MCCLAHIHAKSAFSWPPAFMCLPRWQPPANEHAAALPAAPHAFSTTIRPPSAAGSRAPGRGTRRPPGASPQNPQDTAHPHQLHHVKRRQQRTEHQIDAKKILHSKK